MNIIIIISLFNYFLCTGLLLYFGYSMMHSRKELKAKIKEAQKKEAEGNQVGIIPNNSAPPPPPAQGQMPQTNMTNEVNKPNPYVGDGYNATPYQVSFIFLMIS